MTFQKRVVTDLLFGIQLSCALTFGASQIHKLYDTNTSVSLSWLIFWEAFLVINMFLGFKSHRTAPTRLTKQTLWSYVAWMFVITSYLTLLFIKEKMLWGKEEITSTVVTLVGIFTTFIVFGLKRKSISDPIMKGYLALCFRSIPALFVAYMVYKFNGAGLSGVAIAAGHVTILTRLIPLGLSIKDAGWDKNRVGSAISEIGNEISWLIVTIVWLIV